MQTSATNIVAVEQQQQQQFYCPKKNPAMDVKNMGEKLVQVLETGKVSATQMKGFLDHAAAADDDRCFLKGQLDVALTSFDAAISMVNNYGFFDNQSLKRRNPTPDHHHLHHNKPEDYFGDWEAPRTPKDGRGCYKRRKTEHSWEVERSNTDDGHAWRKYGQKPIQKTKHPRNYYRCTYKTDQGCQATRQVQQISENSPIYKIIYHGHHTCKNPLKTHPMLLDLIDHDKSSMLLSFENSNSTKHGINHFMMFPSSSSPSLLSSSSSSLSSSSTSTPSACPMGNAMVEQEYKPIKEETPSEPSDRHHGAYIQHPSLSDFIPTTSDLTTTTTVSDDVISLAELYSCAVSPHGMKEDFSYIMADQSIDFMSDAFDQDHSLFAW